MAGSNNEAIKSANDFNLIELFQYYWQKKYWIIFSTFIFTCLAYFYTQTIKAEWSSSAEAIPSQINSVEKLLTLQQRYELISGDRDDSTNMTNKLFNQFVNNLSIAELRKNYFLQSSYFSQQRETQQQNSLTKFIKSISIITPDMLKKGNNITVIAAENKSLADILSVKINLIGDEQNTLSRILNDFIQYINRITYQQALNEISFKIKQKIDTLTYQQQQIETKLTLEKQQQIAYLKAAIEAAQHLSGNSHHSESVNLHVELNRLDSPYLYLLGVNNLTAKLEQLTHSAVIYPTEYFQLKQQAEQLNVLLSGTKQLQENVFQYKSTPSDPIKLKPQKSLILIIGLLFGFILSCMLLLFIKAVKKN